MSLCIHNATAELCGTCAAYGSGTISSTLGPPQEAANLPKEHDIVAIDATIIHIYKANAKYNTKLAYEVEIQTATGPVTLTIDARSVRKAT